MDDHDPLRSDGKNLTNNPDEGVTGYMKWVNNVKEKEFKVV